MDEACTEVVRAHSQVHGRHRPRHESLESLEAASDELGPTCKKFDLGTCYKRIGDSNLGSVGDAPEKRPGEEEPSRDGKCLCVVD